MFCMSCPKCRFHIFTTVFVLFVLEEGEKTKKKDEDVQTNIQDVEQGQTRTKYLVTKYKPDVDSHGMHVYFTNLTCLNLVQSIVFLVI